LAFPDLLRAALAEGNHVQLSLRKAACSSMAPPNSTGNPASVYTNWKTAIAFDDPLHSIPNLLLTIHAASLPRHVTFLKGSRPESQLA
jgi:hypothetical protein